MKSSFLRVSLICIILLVILLPLAAAWNEPSLSLHGGWHGSFPSELHQEDIPVRTHGYVSLKGAPISFRLSETFAIELQTEFAYTTASLPYLSVYWKDFFTLGAGVGLRADISERVSLTAGGIYQLQLPDDDRGAFAFLTPYTSVEVLLTKDEKKMLLLSIPVSIELRSDYTAVKSGIGIIYRIAGRSE